MKNKIYGKFSVYTLKNISEVRSKIKLCQKKKHVQQVAYSTYHDSLTQVCFICEKIYTNFGLPSARQVDGSGP